MARGKEAPNVITPPRETSLFVLTLATLVAGFFHASLFGGKVLSSADVLFTTRAFAEVSGTTGDYEPANRLLTDPVLQFGPWLEFTRSEIRAGRLPLWNPYAGCGTPHLANGQSAVFDPVQAIAYALPLPDAIAWMAALRLGIAGLGVFLLARSWGYSPLGRWFSGLTYPFCGFLVGWLLYPVANVAIWMPWLFLAADRAFDGPRGRGIAGLGLASGLVVLGGHVQTSAHVLMAVGLYILLRAGRLVRESRVGASLPPLSRFTAGVILGLGLAAIEILPLASYLARSPVWADRHAERPAILAFTAPRVLDAATTALPYLFGSQQRGHPNLARPLGVHNLNESAGGFVGLATLIWLAPSAWSARRSRWRVGFLAALGLVGALGAFGVSPVVQFLRIFPVINVTDHRRLTLWIAFSLSLLGGVGIDHIGESLRSCVGIWWTRLWIVAAIGLVVGAIAVRSSSETIRRKSIEHYAAAARAAEGSDPAIYRERAERQARQATTFLPLYLAICAAHLLVIHALQSRAGRWPRAIGVAAVGLVVGELFACGIDRNPAIPRSQDRPMTEVIAYLRREVPPPLRVLGIGAEFPPNSFMRYGLRDVRNYDSIEVARSVSWFEPLYEPDPDRPIHTSRREITWKGVMRGLDRLRAAGVGAIVGASPPPQGVFDRVDRVGSTWIARLDAKKTGEFRPSPGEIRIDLSQDRGQVRYVAETFDPGWNAEIDGRPVPIKAYLGTFLSVDISANSRSLIFLYDPPEVRVAAVVSLLCVGLILVLMGAERTSQKFGSQAWIGTAGRVRIESS